MNERGFFSVVGLCLLLVVTLSIMAIQGSEKNYSYLASDFQEEFELQNAADSGLIEAVKKIQENPELVPYKTAGYASRRERQCPVTVTQPSATDRFKNISVKVYGENDDIYKGTRQYYLGGKITNTLNKDSSGKEIFNRRIVLISVASGENNLGVKKFRRSLAYILEEENYKQIYFMDTLSNNE